MARCGDAARGDRLYILNLTVDKLVCLAAHTEEASWR
jgi:hypothetical protein